MVGGLFTVACGGFSSYQGVSCQEARGILGFPVAQLLKNTPAIQQTQVQSLGWEGLLEKEIATHSSILT